MSYPLVTLSEVKAYLGVTGSQDDARIASAASNASIMAARDTGRTFAVTSNTTRIYSTDGQASLVIHDRPYSDPTRVVTWNGATMTEGSSVWFLPDRRDPDSTVTIQLRYYDTSRPDWYKADPDWFDKNLDVTPVYQGAPNDLRITGVIGHPAIPPDVHQAVLELAAYLYWHERSGASGIVQTPQGDQVELASDFPESYQAMVRNWRIRTAVSAV
jgi:hypothetical protein